MLQYADFRLAIFHHLKIITAGRELASLIQMALQISVTKVGDEDNCFGGFKPYFVKMVIAAITKYPTIIYFRKRKR